MCVSITRCFYSKSSSSFYCSVSPPTAAAIERCDLPISRTPGCFRHSPGSPTISSLFPHTCFKCTFSPLNLHKHRSSSCLTISQLFLTFPLHPSHPRLLFCAAVPRSTGQHNHGPPRYYHVIWMNPTQSTQKAWIGNAMFKGHLNNL